MVSGVTPIVKAKQMSGPPESRGPQESREPQV